MSDIPDFEKPDEQYAYDREEPIEAIIGAIQDAVYMFLGDPENTQEEIDELMESCYDVGFWSIDAFKPDVISTEIGPNGEKKFLFSMTIPNETVYETLTRHVRELEAAVLLNEANGFPDDEEEDENDK